MEWFLAGFETHLKEYDLANSSNSYLGDIRRFFQWFSERDQFNPDAVTKLDIIDYRNYFQEFGGGRKGRGAAPSTVNRALISLRVFFERLDRKEQAALLRTVSS